MYRNTVSSPAGGSAPESQGAGAPAKPREGSSWYTKIASAWGAALDRQADKTVALARQLNEGEGNDGLGAAVQVSAAAHQLTFLAQAAANVNNSIGEALQTLGRKQ